MATETAPASFGLSNRTDRLLEGAKKKQNLTERMEMTANTQIICLNFSETGQK
jgi:hypothetical protein